MATKKTGKKKKTQKTKRPANKKRKSFSKQNWLIALAIAAFAFLLYANTLGHDYALDDFSVIKENYVVKKGVAGIPTIWKTHYRFGYWNSKASLYRPMTLTVFAMIWSISKDSTMLYHLVNVLFFSGTCLLLFLTLRRLLPKRNILLPLAISLLFAAHPIHVEVVANIKALDDIMSFFFCLLAINLLWRYLDNKGLLWMILSVFCYGIALFSKEGSITFLAIFPLAIYFFTKEKISKTVLLTLPYLIPVVLYLIARHRIVGSLTGDDAISFLDNILMGTDSKANQIATAFMLAGKYLVNLVAPYQLGHDFGYNQIKTSNFTDWRVLISLVAYVGMGLFAVWQLTKKNIIAFGILFFLITFSLVSNIIFPIGTSYGDRLMYMPSFGFCVAFAATIFHFLKVDTSNLKSNAMPLIKSNLVPMGIIGLFTLLFAIKTISRNPAWKNSYTLYKTDVEKFNDGAKLNYHYGLELVKKGLDAKDPTEKQKWLNESQRAFEKAIEIYPKYHDAYGQLGLAYYRKNDYNKALELYNQSISYKPNSPKVYSNMGIIYYNRGDMAKAQEVYEKAVKLDPKMVDARRNLGSVYAMSKRFPDAIQQFSEALKYAPNDPIINNYLGSAYRDSGNMAQAKPYLDKACRLDENLCNKKKNQKGTTLQ